MTVVNYGKDYKYAATRLSDTIVRIGKLPVYVYSVSNKGLVELKNFFDVSQTTAFLSELDLSPMPLGYVNKGSKSVHTKRMPHRHYKQGLNGNTLASNGVVGYSDIALMRTVAGFFPSVAECVESVLCGESFVKAYSRDFALKTLGNHTEELSLQFKERDVGVASWNSQGKRLNYKLHDKFSFLTEMAEGSFYVK